MRGRSAFAIIAAMYSTLAAALDRADQFERGFNKEANRLRVSIRAGAARCDDTGCNYNLSPRGALWVGYTGNNRAIDEIAAYFDPDARGGHDALEAIAVLIAVVGSDQPPSVRSDALKVLVGSATSALRDGEITLSRWRYVLRPSDGRDIRIYVRKVAR